MLVVVKDGNVETFLEAPLDLETFRRLDIFEINRAECRLEAGNRFHQRVDVDLVDLEIEHVDIGELLEEDGLALHHRLRRKRADRAEPQHRTAVADHRHEVGTGGIVPHAGGVLLDLLARRRHARAIGQRQVPLRRHALGRVNAEFSRLRLAMVIECRLTQVFNH